MSSLHFREPETGTFHEHSLTYGDNGLIRNTLKKLVPYEKISINKNKKSSPLFTL
jgi:hypothetical protein